MAEAFSRFRDLFEEIPEEVRYCVLDICCKSVGIPGGPVGVVSFEMLTSKLEFLVSEIGLDEFLLIPGLLQSAIDSFEYQAHELEQLVKSDPAFMIQSLRGIGDNIPDSLKHHFTEERLLEMQNWMDELFRDAPELIVEFRRNALLIHSLKQKHFPLDSWKASIHRLID